MTARDALLARLLVSVDGESLSLRTERETKDESTVRNARCAVDEGVKCGDSIGTARRHRARSADDETNDDWFDPAVSGVR